MEAQVGKNDRADAHPMGGFVQIRGAREHDRRFARDPPQRACGLHRRLRIRKVVLKGKSDKIAMVAFDLLYLNGYDVRKLPLIERKTLLKKLIVKTAIQFSESFEVDGPEMFKHACGIGLEGVVSKVGTADIIPAEATIGSRRPARNARP